MEACHRLRNKHRTIVKFSSRRKIAEIFNKKKILKDTGSRIYINESLCPYYKGLWNKCRNLKTEDKIHSFWTHNGNVKIKIYENSTPTILTHDVDVESLLGSKGDE